MILFCKRIPTEKNPLKICAYPLNTAFAFGASAHPIRVLKKQFLGSFATLR